MKATRATARAHPATPQLYLSPGQDALAPTIRRLYLYICRDSDTRFVVEPEGDLGDYTYILFEWAGKGYVGLTC